MQPKINAVITNLQEIYQPLQYIFITSGQFRLPNRLKIKIIKNKNKKTFTSQTKLNEFKRIRE